MFSTTFPFPDQNSEFSVKLKEICSLCEKGLLMFYKELDDYSNIFENLFQNLIDICYLFHSSEIIVLGKITQGTVSKFAIC